MQPRFFSRPSPYARRGISLIDVLASLAIILVLLAILVPAIGAGRKEAGVAQCMSNLKAITATGMMYSDDHAKQFGGGNRPTLPWHLGFYSPWGSFGLITEFVYGGYKTTTDAGEFPDADVRIVPTEYRPFNKYIAPGIAGTSPLRQYVCPADMSGGTPTVGDPGSLDPENGFSSWEANGNSYAINWYWVERAPNSDNIYSDIQAMHAHGTAMLSKKIGASASKFVVFMEAAMNAYMYDARPPNWPEPSPLSPGMGWHGRHSTYAMAMWDGHAEYRFIDTRYTSDYGYDTWPEPNTQWPLWAGKHQADRED